MYFPFGWPSLLQTACPPEHGHCTRPTYLHADQEYVIAVSEASVCVWSGAQARLRLAHLRLSDDDVIEGCGVHTAAYWSPERSRLAVLVGGGGHTTPELIPATGTKQLWTKHSTCHDVICCCVHTRNLL